MGMNERSAGFVITTAPRKPCSLIRGEFLQKTKIDSENCKEMVRVMEGLMPSEAIELLREPLESLGFVQLCLLSRFLGSRGGSLSLHGRDY